MKSKFLKIMLFLALSSALASCGEAEPLEAKDFFAELTRQGIKHEFRPTRRGNFFERRYFVCLDEFKTTNETCFDDDFSVSQYNTAEPGWKGAYNEAVKAASGEDLIITNGNLIMNVGDPRRVSEKMRKVIKIFESFD